MPTHHAKTIHMTLRREDRTHDVKWPASTMALLVCDVWDAHWCTSASARVAELAPAIQRVITSAREQGVFIVHCPSNCMSAYEGTRPRLLARSVRLSTPAKELTTEKRFGTGWCYRDPQYEPQLPIDDSDGGCDCAEPCTNVDQPVWTRQSQAISIDDTDAVTEDGQELFSLLRERGIQRVCVCGVHLNMCLLGRGFGIRPLTGPMGMTCVLLRDLTDTMYNPRAPPYIEHFAGTALCVRHVEAHACATAHSSQLLGLLADPSPSCFRFRYDGARGRVAVGGFQHETNVFSSSQAAYSDFEAGGSYPGLARGEEMLHRMRSTSLPIAGFMKSAAEAGLELAPLTWASAEPCAHVQTAAFNRIVGALCDDLRRETEGRGIDGVYLDLHGAMVTQEHDDGEAEILRRVRAVVGELPLVVSLDWHANLSEDVFLLSDAITIFRTYPHIDMRDTGSRACALLEARLRLGAPLQRAWRAADYLIPITSQYHEAEPAKTLCRSVVEAARGQLLSADFAPGFPASDGPACRPALCCYGLDAVVVGVAADRLIGAVAAAEPLWANELLDPDAAVAAAMLELASSDAAGPVVIADAQDNPGAGGSSDTVGMLTALVRAGGDGVIAILHDPAAASKAHAVGVGGSFSCLLGGRCPGHTPFESDFDVVRLGDGVVLCGGEMMKGVISHLGLTALVRVAGSAVKVLVSTNRVQALDRAYLRHVGIAPEEERVIIVKSSVHFRAEFGPIARRIIVAAAPGKSARSPSAWPPIEP